MPENQNTSLPIVSYDSLNRDLRTVRFYFDAQEKSVQGFNWEEDIQVGARIAPGRRLAHISWDPPPDEPVVAPDGCEGRAAAPGGPGRRRGEGSRQQAVEDEERARRVKGVSLWGQFFVEQVRRQPAAQEPGVYLLLSDRLLCDLLPLQVHPQPSSSIHTAHRLPP